MQRLLSAEQVSAFHHDEFVAQQLEHFTRIVVPALRPGDGIVDMGGGCGYFARALSGRLSLKVRVVDRDPVSVDIARTQGVDASVGDALKPVMEEDDRLVCFNLILHHLVGPGEKATFALQSAALSAWKDAGVKVYVNEYIYESWIDDASGWLIYQITSSRLLSAIGRMVATFVPSLRANTFGVGVRFRSNRGWKALFEQAGFTLVEEMRGTPEIISIPRRLLLIKTIRRDSFLLRPKG